MLPNQNAEWVSTKSLVLIVGIHQVLKCTVKIVHQETTECGVVARRTFVDWSADSFLCFSSGWPKDSLPHYYGFHQTGRRCQRSQSRDSVNFEKSILVV